MQGLASPLLAMYAGTDVVELTPANFQKEVVLVLITLHMLLLAGDQERQPVDR